MKGLNQLKSWDKLTRWQTSRTMLLYSRLCFLFSFPFSPLTAKAVPLPSNAHYAKAGLSNVMLISRRRQSVLHRRRMNHSRVWVHPRDQRWFGARKYKCRYQTPYSEAYAGVFAAPDYISHGDRDDWQILRKSQHGADQTADKRPLTRVKARKRY